MMRANCAGSPPAGGPAGAWRLASLPLLISLVVATTRLLMEAIADMKTGPAAAFWAAVGVLLRPAAVESVVDGC